MSESAKKRAFTNWINHKLRQGDSGRTVESFEDDLKNGVVLCCLLEHLSGSTLKYNKKPRMFAAIENCNTCVKFIQQDQKIRIENIGGQDIYEGNLKLTLGLVYSLILHYQSSEASYFDSSLNIKDRYLKYINDSLSGPYGLSVSNLAADLSDGKVLTALCHLRAPDEFPHPDSLGSDSLANVRAALNFMRDKFSVPLVVDANDLANRPSQETTITFLSLAIPELEENPVKYTGGGRGRSTTPAKEEVIEVARSPSHVPAAVVVLSNNNDKAAEADRRAAEVTEAARKRAQKEADDAAAAADARKRAQKEADDAAAAADARKRAQKDADAAADARRRKSKEDEKRRQAESASRANSDLTSRLASADTVPFIITLRSNERYVLSQFPRQDTRVDLDRKEGNSDSRCSWVLVEHRLLASSDRSKCLTVFNQYEWETEPRHNNRVGIAPVDSSMDITQQWDVSEDGVISLRSDSTLCLTLWLGAAGPGARTDLEKRNPSLKGQQWTLK